MEKGVKGCPMIRMDVSECFFWYRPTQVVPEQRPLNGCCVVIYFVDRNNNTLFWSFKELLAFC